MPEWHDNIFGVFKQHAPVQGNQHEREESILDALISLLSSCWGDEKGPRNKRQNFGSNGHRMTPPDETELALMLRNSDRYSEAKIRTMINRIDGFLDSFHSIDTLDDVTVTKILAMKANRNTLAMGIRHQHRHFTFGSKGAHKDSQLQSRYPLGLIPHDKAIQIERLLSANPAYISKHLTEVESMVQHLRTIIHILDLDTPIVDNTFTKADLFSFHAEYDHLKSAHSHLIDLMVSHRHFPPAPKGKAPGIPHTAVGYPKKEVANYDMFVNRGLHAEDSGGNPSFNPDSIHPSVFQPIDHSNSRSASPLLPHQPPPILSEPQRRQYGNGVSHFKAVRLL
jgi:hypothetical protein